MASFSYQTVKRTFDSLKTQNTAARIATAPVLIGLVFLGLGLLRGEGGYHLLLFSGIDLALSSKPGSYEGTNLFLVLLMGAVGVAVNPALAFAIGLPLAYAARHGWLRV